MNTSRIIAGISFKMTLHPGGHAQLNCFGPVVSSAFGENLPIPEIIAIGGQSDGKSSLLEAFLGFRFNIREVEMGTRRPLMLQMVHDPTAQEPRVSLQDEDSDEYGPPIKPESGE